MARYLLSSMRKILQIGVKGPNLLMDSLKETGLAWIKFMKKLTDNPSITLDSDQSSE